MQLLPDLDDEPVVALEVLVDERREEVGGVEGRIVFVVQVQKASALGGLYDVVKILLVANLFVNIWKF